MKVVGLSADPTGGVGFYRLLGPAEEARALGVDVEISLDGAVDAIVKQTADGTLEVEEIITDADVLIIQRPVSPVYISMIKQAHRQGIATVVETDDDISMVHGRNVYHEGLQNSSILSPKIMEEAANLADHVTVSTPALTKYARHGRYSILRNNVPQSIFDVKINHDFSSPRVGWTGSVTTHPDDLQQTKGAVATVLKDNGLDISVIGSGVYVATNLGLSPETKVYSTGWTPYETFYESVARYIDIGIVPLEMSPFNEAKSALKGMEFAALGIPFVASPTREYLRMEAYGIGKTAKTPGEWRKHLQRMIDRTSETERIAKEARDRMEAEFTYKVNAPEWIDAWEKAIHYRKSH